LNFPQFSGNCQRTLSFPAIEAIKLFDEGKYLDANKSFSKLTKKYPNDPLYQFYLGASILEINGSIDEAIDLLTKSSIKIDNAQINYYFGMAHYKKFNFNKASEYFDKAKKLSSKSDPNKIYIENYLDIVSNYRNYFTNPENITASQLGKTENFNIVKELQKNIIEVYEEIITINNDTSSIIQFSYEKKQFAFISLKNKKTNHHDIYIIIKKNDVWENPQMLKKPINSDYDEIYPFYKDGYLYFSSNRESTLGGYDIYRCPFDTVSYQCGNLEYMKFPINSTWNDFLLINLKNDIGILVSDRESLLGEVILYKISYGGKIKEDFSSEILNNRCFFKKEFENSKIKLAVVGTRETESEKSTTTVKNKNKRISEALSYQKIADSILIEIRNIKNELGITKNKDKRAKLFSELKIKENEYKNYQDKANEIYENISPESSKSENKNNNDKKTNQLFEFNIKERSQYSENNPIPVKPVFPNGVVYTIQLGVFSKSVDPNFFGGIEPIMAEFLIDKNLVKYYAGIFRNFNDADSSLTKIKAMGFKEAFIVSFYDDKKIPLSRAKEME